ncbi:MAG: hypothetical protein ACKO7B_00090, partial [Flavobacteriales bacterium]
VVTAVNPTFKAICDHNVSIFPSDGYSRNKESLAHGTGILSTHEQMNAYIACYADMHRAKLYTAFDQLFQKGDLQGAIVEVVDWGCGQAFAACTLFDYVREKKIDLTISQITLIEPSAAALNRGWEHIDALCQGIARPQVVMINNIADAKLVARLKSEGRTIKLHLFSNILDISSVSLDQIQSNIVNSFKGDNYFVCVSPINNGGARLKLFFNKFRNAVMLNEHA